MPSSRPVERLDDILENIGRIETYVTGYDAERFAKDYMRQDAVERCLLRISEAAKKLGEQAETLAPGQPWSDIRSMDNVLRHDYDNVDPDIIWRVATVDLRSLKEAVESALATLRRAF